MRLSAEDTRNTQSHLIVLPAVNDLHIALLTGALELNHISRQGEKTYEAYNSRAALGTAVRNHGML